jgi:hypothetical protein
VIAFLRSFARAFLCLVINAEVTVFANALSIESAVVMLADHSLLCPTLRVVAVLAHSVRIVVLGRMSALCDEFSMLLDHFSFLTAAGGFLFHSAHFGLLSGVNTIGTFWYYILGLVSRVATLLSFR